MKRVRIAKDFAQLTRPNGLPIWINGSAVSSIRSPLPNDGEIAVPIVKDYPVYNFKTEVRLTIDF